MSSDRLTVEQVAILKAADANGKLLHDTDMRRLFKHIEALEGEVARLNKAHNERLKQNTLERAATHKQFHRAEAAEARAERLRVALEEAVAWMNGCAVSGGYPAWHAKAIKALQDDKPIRAAAGGEG
jgi:hypothetical protein